MTRSNVSQSGEVLTKYNLRNILYALHFNRIFNINLIISPVVCIFHSDTVILYNETRFTYSTKRVYPSICFIQKLVSDTLLPE